MKHALSFKKRVFGMIFLILCVSSFTVMAQVTTVKGVVKDVSNSSLIGVSVRVAGTTIGTITDANGKFSIQVAPNAKLIFSYIGFDSQTIPVKGQSNLNVNLLEQTQKLNEVEVIGYGTQRKEAVTGSVATVSGNALKEIPSANITDALQGRVAGVDLEQTSSQPGATLQIRIRGTRSLTATNDPLIVLDGIPFSGSISDISTDDIKSIDILKDASATAIYGSRGANGVILITTNKGVSGAAVVSYNGYYGLGTAIYYPMMNGPEFVALRAASGRYTTNGLDESNTVNTNWQKLFYTNAIVENHDLSVSGGNDKGSYKFGASYYSDQAVIPGQNYVRYAIRGSLDQEVGKYLRFGFTSNTNFNVTNGASLGLYGVLSQSPIANPYNADGTLKRFVQMPMDQGFVLTKGVIDNLGDTWKDQQKALGSYNSFYGEIKIPGVEGLKYRTNIGANFNFSNHGTYSGVGVMSATPTTPSNASLTNSYSTDWTVENMLTYDRVFAQKNRVNAIALYSAEQDFYNSTYISANNIPADNLQFYNIGQSAASDITINPSDQGYTVWGLESWMGRVIYSYDDRYMLSATVRSDGSSRLSSGHQWHTYPAVSAGWNIMKESFMKDINWIDALKLRAGYGQTSNQSVTPYSTLGSLNTTPYNFGTSYLTGYNVATLPNPKLGWEFSITENLGLDFSLLKSRLTGTAEYYITNTKNLLESVNLPPTSGVGSYTANVGATQNKGFELSLNGVILDNLNGWTWEVGVNVYHNVNKLVSLASGETEDISNSWFVGHPLNVIYDYKKIGLWNTTDKDYKYLQTLQPGGVAGMIKVQYTGTYNADGSPTRAIGAADEQVQNLDPDFQGGFNTRVDYKGFDLNVVANFQGGGTLVSTLYGSAGYLNLMTGRRGNINVDFWTPTNTKAAYPNPAGPLSGDNMMYGSTMGYFSASYLKIETITLGYNFNQKWLKYAGIEKLRLYCTVQNPLILFSPYHNQSGMDPETNSYGDQNSAVSSYVHRILTVGYNTPSTHNYLIGLNVTF
jgi:TonB-linked SusC/RagA family outer membrane protein